MLFDLHALIFPVFWFVKSNGFSLFLHFPSFVCRIHPFIFSSKSFVYFRALSLSLLLFCALLSVSIYLSLSLLAFFSTSFVVCIFALSLCLSCSSALFFLSLSISLSLFLLFFLRLSRFVCIHCFALRSGTHTHTHTRAHTHTHTHTIECQQLSGRRFGMVFPQKCGKSNFLDYFSIKPDLVAQSMLHQK